MKEQEAPLTLRDIARQAGVSLATADRVLHNRPGVRPDTVRRVKEAIERNAFQPQMAAAELARGRARRFAFVMPSGPNLFMQQIEAYLDEMSAWLSARRLAVEMVATDVFDAPVLASTLESLAGDFDGVAVVALDHPSVRAAINDLVDGGTNIEAQIGGNLFISASPTVEFVTRVTNQRDQLFFDEVVNVLGLVIGEERSDRLRLFSNFNQTTLDVRQLL